MDCSFWHIRPESKNRGLPAGSGNSVLLELFLRRGAGDLSQDFGRNASGYPLDVFHQAFQYRAFPSQEDHFVNVSPRPGHQGVQ